MMFRSSTINSASRGFCCGKLVCLSRTKSMRLIFSFFFLSLLVVKVFALLYLNSIYVSLYFCFTYYHTNYAHYLVLPSHYKSSTISSSTLLSFNKSRRGSSSTTQPPVLITPLFRRHLLLSILEPRPSLSLGWNVGYP